MFSQPRHLLQALGISISFDRSLCGCAIDVADIGRREFECDCSDVFVEAIQFGCAGDWNDPWLLREQPGQRNLGRSCILPLRDGAEQIDQRLVCLESLRRKTRKRTAEVGALELGVFFDRSREEAFAEWAIRNEADSEF